MSRVITFSRTFPSYHPRAGEPTYFVEKFWKSLWDQDKFTNVSSYENIYNEVFPIEFNKLENIHNHLPKHHTIRVGNRWKEGDKFSPRVWSGNPYRSHQIVLAPDIEIKKVWDFEILEGFIIIDGYEFFGGELSNHELLAEIAKNDGLDPDDLLDWFQYPKRFEGQIISWNENINY